MKRLRGFTLLELLVVMAIIGILAAIGLASYGTVQSKARDARRKNDLESIARALELFYNDHGRYPIVNEPDDMGFSTGFWGNKWQLSDGTLYMSIIPSDPRAARYRLQVFHINSAGTILNPCNRADTPDCTTPPNAYWLLAHLENTEDSKAARLDSGAPAIYSNSTLGLAADSCGGTGDGCNYVLSSPNAPLPDKASLP